MTLPWGDGRQLPPLASSERRRRRWAPAIVVSIGAATVHGVVTGNASPVWAGALVALAVVAYLALLAGDGIVPRFDRTPKGGVHVSFHSVENEEPARDTGREVKEE